MVRRKVWKAIPKDKIPSKAKVLSSTWACKKKSNGTFRARLNARGFEQKDGEHFDSSSISAPVTNDATIRICLVLMLMAGWVRELLDVKGAFLHGAFDDGEQIYMSVPEGFEEYYPAGVVLLLLRTIYELRQAAMAFWRMIL